MTSEIEKLRAELNALRESHATLNTLVADAVAFDDVTLLHDWVADMRVVPVEGYQCSYADDYYTLRHEAEQEPGRGR